MLSRQTRSKGSFAYHPLNDAVITLFPLDGPPRRFILKSIPFQTPPAAEAANGRVHVELTSAHLPGYEDGASSNQLCVMVNGKRTERYSIVYPGRKAKKRFAKY